MNPAALFHPAVSAWLAEGFTTSRGRRGTLIHHDAINRVLRGRRGAQLTALTSGGTIPDTADSLMRAAGRESDSWTSPMNL
jgi:hypothetical protein